MEGKMNKKRKLYEDYLYDRIRVLELAGYEHKEDGRINLNLFESLVLKQAARVFAMIFDIEEEGKDE
jgi:hypothetical protein